jgi:electron-transferring-flavoprotein dehydrogenase
VLELLAADKPFTKENLAEAYERRRRESWIEKEARVAEKSRDGFQTGLVKGMIGMAIAAFSGGIVSLGDHPEGPCDRIEAPEEFYRGKMSAAEIAALREDCDARNVALRDALMDRCGWPQIECDGTLLVTQQDALLMGGKVQAPAGYADHVTFRDREACQRCGAKLCVEICSGNAITRGDDGAPVFDREKCVFCGGCLWNCATKINGETNLQFRAGAGGLHSAEN